MTKNRDTPIGPNPSKMAPAGKRIMPYDTPSKMLSSRPRKTAGRDVAMRKDRSSMYAGRATVFAPLRDACQALLNCLRSGRFVKGVVTG